MRSVKNIDKQKLEIPFEFWTYIFPEGKVVSVEQNLFEFLEERFPLSFSFGKQLEKEKPVEVEKFKTAVYMQAAPDQLGTEDMRIQAVKQTPTFGTPDGLPPSGQSDKDGIAFYGEGIEVEGA